MTAPNSDRAFRWDDPLAALFKGVLAGFTVMLVGLPFLYSRSETVDTTDDPWAGVRSLLEELILLAVLALVVGLLVTYWTAKPRASERGGRYGLRAAAVGAFGGTFLAYPVAYTFSVGMSHGTLLSVATGVIYAVLGGFGAAHALRRNGHPGAETTGVLAGGLAFFPLWWALASEGSFDYFPRYLIPVGAAMLARWWLTLRIG